MPPHPPQQQREYTEAEENESESGSSGRRSQHEDPLVQSQPMEKEGSGGIDIAQILQQVLRKEVRYDQATRLRRL